MKHLFLRHEYLIITFLSTGWTLLVGRKLYDGAMQGERGWIVRSALWHSWTPWLYGSGCKSINEVLPREEDRLWVSQTASLEQLVLGTDITLRSRARIGNRSKDWLWPKASLRAQCTFVVSIALTSRYNTGTTLWHSRNIEVWWCRNHEFEWNGHS